VSTAFAHLSKPQVWGLLLWSAGIALTGTAGITQISVRLALVPEQQEQAVFGVNPFYWFRHTFDDRLP
jgi:hypothetical protein